MTTCPTCKHDWPDAGVYDRVRAWRGDRTMTEAVQGLGVGRITYGRIEAGIRTSWPDWLAVFSAAGLTLLDAHVAWAEAKAQKGGVLSDSEIREHVLGIPPAPMSSLVRVLTPPVDAPELMDAVQIRAETAALKRAAGKKDQFRHVPDGEVCGWHYMTVGYVRNGKPVASGIEEYRGYCNGPHQHVADGVNHAFDKSVAEPKEVAK